MRLPINGVAHMMRRALNTLDYRLMDHGERVAYIVFSLLKRENKYTDEQLKEASYLSMFHDIGAYKTEMIDSLIDIDKAFKFELNDSLDHSIYSYLFLKNFTFSKKFVDALLFHHFPYSKLMKTECNNKSLAAKLFMADRIDILLTKGLAKTTDELFKLLENPVFSQEEVLALKEIEEEHGTLTKILNSEYLEELLTFLNTKMLNDNQVASLVEMLPYTIDFRSESTVTHTVATVEITIAIAELAQLSEEDHTKLYYGALLHDIGKISTSLMILEKEGMLSDFEFIVMKDHVLLSEYILKGRVEDDVLNIAIRHHEKLDGSGYPYGLKENELNINERIVAIADILSALMGKRSYKEPFSKDRVISIIKKLSDDGKICSEIVNLVLENYDGISKRVEECNRNAMIRYKNISDEFHYLVKKYEGFM